MAITTGNTSESGLNNNVNTSFDWAHTCAAGSDCLVVLVTGLDATEGDLDVSGVTYDGNPLTYGAGSADSTSGTNAEIWYLVNPTTGSSLDIEVTFAGKVSSGAGFAIDLDGVDTSDPVQDTNRVTGANSDPTITVSGAVSGSMTVGGLGINESDPAEISVSAGTEIGETDLGTALGSSAYRADSGVLTWDHVSEDWSWVVAAVNFNAAAAPSANIPAAMNSYRQRRG